MTAIRKMTRRQGAARRMDLTDLKATLADNSLRIAVGVVSATHESDKHYEIIMDGGTISDVLVDVEFVPHGTDVTCRLGSFAGGVGDGLWRIPAEGTEVIVGIPQLGEGGDDISWMPTIIAVLSTGVLPERISDSRTVLVAPDRIEIIAPQVYISSNGTSGEPLITKTQFDTHVHPTGVGPSSTPTNAPTSGTTVLKAE